MVIVLGTADLLKFIGVGWMPLFDCRFGGGSSGAEGAGKSGVYGDGFAQHFLHRANIITPKMRTIPIMAVGDENSQWVDWKGLSSSSNLWSNSLAWNDPVMVEPNCVTICVICLLSWWLKSCAKVIVQSSQVE